MQSGDYRKERPARFGGDEGAVYNPKITYYYNSSHKVIRVDEEVGGVIYKQTISGTTSSGLIDTTTSYYEVFSPWVKV